MNIEEQVKHLSEERDKLLTLANDYRGKAYAIKLTINKLKKEQIRNEKRIKELVG